MPRSTLVGLKTKATLALALVFLMIQAVYVLVEDRMFLGEATAALERRARLFSDLYAGAISVSVWEYDKDATLAQFGPLKTQLPEFKAASVEEPDGKPFVALAKDGGSAPIITAESEIRYADRLIGRLRISLSESLLEAERAAHFRRLISTAAIMGSALLILTLIALTLVIRPLTRITALMRGYAAGELERGVPYLDRPDEVGAMARALDVFRDTSRQRRAVEQELQRRSEELDRLNQDLRRARDAAETANRVKSDFLAAMSHEIRTPLNGIIGMLHLLAGSPLDAGQRERLDTLEKSAQSLLSLLNDILDLAKIEAGRVDLHVAPFSLHELLGNLVTLWQPSIQSKGLTLTATLSPAIPRLLLGDANRLGQVVSNYLSNAVKFTERGGVELVAEAQPVGEGLHEISIAVRDTGIGIPPAVQGRLFQKFSQAEIAASRPGSTGLGLAISKELVHLMNGELGVDSTPGKGSTFWLRLRCREAEAGTEIKSDAITSDALLQHPGTRSLHLLVAEDNPVNQRVVGAMLEMAGHRFSIAENGRQALEAVQRESFDAVLMDVQMPEMDGPTAARAIRALGGRHLELPIVALTANALPGDEETYRAAGMNHYLTKPFSPDELSLALRRAAGSDAARIPSTTWRPGPKRPEFTQEQALGELLKHI